MIADAARSLTIRQPLAFESGDYHSDVVRTAPTVGEVDQRLTEIRQAIRCFDQLADLLSSNLTRKAVRTYDQGVSPAQRLMGEIHLHARIRSERLENDVAPLALIRFLLGQLTCVHQALHQRLVLREL